MNNYQLRITNYELQNMEHGLLDKSRFAAIKAPLPSAEDGQQVSRLRTLSRAEPVPSAVEGLDMTASHEREGAAGRRRSRRPAALSTPTGIVIPTKRPQGARGGICRLTLLPLRGGFIARRAFHLFSVPRFPFQPPRPGLTPEEGAFCSLPFGEGWGGANSTVKQLNTSSHYEKPLFFSSRCCIRIRVVHRGRGA
jgi:hypothetical protein